MLKEKLINVKQGLIGKRKKSILRFAGLALIVFVGFFFLLSQVLNRQNQTPQKNQTLMNLITGDPNKNAFYPCPKRHNVSYIWMKGEMPSKYKQFVDRCKTNINIVTEEDYHHYVKLWNEKFPQYEMKQYDKWPFVLQIEFLKKLHLYFKGGIYSDFDTEIDQTCWENVITELPIFTNYWNQQGPMLPQENFIKVPKPFDHRLENWIIEHIYQRRGYSNRWDQCRMEGCFMMLCQVHNYQNTWVNK